MRIHRECSLHNFSEPLNCQMLTACHFSDNGCKYAEVLTLCCMEAMLFEEWGDLCQKVATIPDGKDHRVVITPSMVQFEMTTLELLLDCFKDVSACSMLIHTELWDDLPSKACPWRSLKRYMKRSLSINKPCDI